MRFWKFQGGVLYKHFFTAVRKQEDENLIVTLEDSAWGESLQYVKTPLFFSLKWKIEKISHFSISNGTLFVDKTIRSMVK